MCIILDFKNVSIVGHYVKDRTRDAQFIIIRYVIQIFWVGLTVVMFTSCTNKS